jgi:hypothetical protein
MSRRDNAIVAWHEVPGTAPPQKSRPVGYGNSRGCAHRFEDWREEISNAVSLSRIEMILKCMWDQLRPIIPYPTGRFFRGTLSQALRAWLRSAVPPRQRSFLAPFDQRQALRKKVGSMPTLSGLLPTSALKTFVKRVDRSKSQFGSGAYVGDTGL